MRLSKSSFVPFFFSLLLLLLLLPLPFLPIFKNNGEGRVVVVFSAQFKKQHSENIFNILNGLFGVFILIT